MSGAAPKSSWTIQSRVRAHERKSCRVSLVEGFPAENQAVTNAKTAPRYAGWFFTGRLLDTEYGQYYFRNRYYGSGLGRFGARDPIGYADGLNLYAGYFVPGGVDPFGLKDATLLINEKTKPALIELALNRRTFQTDIVTKSVINGILPTGAIIPDRDQGFGGIAAEFLGLGILAPSTVPDNATERLYLFGALAQNLGVFNQNPETDVKDGLYRMYTRVTVRFRCESDDSITILSMVQDKDAGIEADFPWIESADIYGTINLRTSRRLRGNRLILIWRGWGRPNSLAELGMQWVAKRTSTHIWHKGEIWLECNNGIGTHSLKNFDGSRFPTHRLWINGGAPVATLPQGSLSDLWYADGANETFVK